MISFAGVRDSRPSGRLFFCRREPKKYKIVKKTKKFQKGIDIS